MSRILMILILTTFYSIIVNAQTIKLSRHTDSTAWRSAKVLQMQLNCSDSQFYRIYEAGLIKLHQLDSVSILPMQGDMQTGSVYQINHLFYENLKDILSVAQWVQFKDAEKRRRDTAIERLKKLGAVVNGLPQDDIN